jgi:hypothetical protein
MLSKDRSKNSSTNSKASSHPTTNSRQPSNHSGPICRNTSRRKKSRISWNSRTLYNKPTRRNWRLRSNGRRSLFRRVVTLMHLISRPLRRWRGWWRHRWIICRICLGSFRVSRRASCLLEESSVSVGRCISFLWQVMYMWIFMCGGYETELRLCYQIVPLVNEDNDRCTYDTCNC